MRMHPGWLVPLGLIGLWFASGAHAHESRPAYLELTERSAGVYEVQWRRPTRGEQVLSMQPTLPEHCTPVGPRARYSQPGALVERWTIDCGASGLVGRAIGIDGLQTTLTDVLARVALADGAIHTHVLRPNATHFTLPGQPSRWQVSAEYSRLGVEHILLGVDHLSFVLALILIVVGWKRLLATITAFTLAHSFTLAAATLGFVHVPQAPVEAAIALSIVFVAMEILRQKTPSPLVGEGRGEGGGLTTRAPWIVAFTFGLLHGLGFAGALSEIGLPEGNIPLALLFFNVGVELGQLLFIATVLSFIALIRRVQFRFPHWAGLVPPYAIGSVAMFWVLQRVAAF